MRGGGRRLKRHPAVRRDTTTGTLLSDEQIVTGGYSSKDR